MSGVDEFDLIARWFAPLADPVAARGLLDDAAVLRVVGDLVVTTDAIVEGVHFLPDDPIETVGRKALRVNLSDLAAKGARPLGYLLTLAWPSARPSSAIAGLAAGLAEDQAAFSVTLLGGDTVSTPGPLLVSITALGAPISRRAPARSGAQVGDDVWVTGAIGDGALGLCAARGLGGEAPESVRAALIARYRLPTPRLEAAALVGALASAAMDVSDGLFADAAKIATASGVHLAIDAAAIPRSEAAKAWLTARPQDAALLALGDDYELLFTAAPEARGRLEADHGVRLTRIGRVEAGVGASLDSGPAPGGYVHHLGR